MTNWDRAVFTLPNNFSFPISQAMSPTPQPYTDVNAGWSIDYASSSPSFMVVVAQGQYVNSSYSWPSYSTNYGVSWTAWPSTPEAYPGATNAGSIAASTSSNWIYWPSSSNNNSVGTQPWFTTNGGTSWSVVSLANPALGATTGTGLSSPTTTGAPTSGLATMTVGSCAKAVAGESVYDNTVGATLGQIISCVSTTLTLNQNPPSESYGATDALYFFGVPDIQNTAATSSWLTSNNTISVASCSNIFAGEAVLDSTTSLRTVGTVASCSSTTLTLTGDASVASEGSSDSLWFSAWGEGGSGQGGYTNISKLVAADRVNANTFYLYFGYGTASSYSGVYVTTNGGASWTFAANVAFGFTAGSIQTTPNEAGDLWFCGGPYPTGSHPGNSQFSHSSDRGSTWTSPTVNVKECAGLGFGAPKVSGNYPTIYSATWYNGGSGVTYNFGIYRSADEGVTWSQVCDANCSQFPLNSLSQIHWVSGDMNQYGSVYLGTNNNGFSWGIFP